MSQSPRRVTILVDSLLGGGAERVAVETACALDPTRYVAHLLVTRHGGPLEELVRANGLECTILDRRRGFHPRAFARACRAVRDSSLVHAHKLEGSMWGAAMARITRRPLVAHEHTFDGTRTRRRTLGYRYLIAPTASRILCVSDYVAASLRDEGVQARLLETVPNGVRTDLALPRATARAELGLDPAATVVGIVGRLRPEKRHDLALQALNAVRAAGHDVVLCCVGDGPLRGSLETLAAELGLAEHVVFAGELPDAGRLAKAFDVGLLCSVYEGMPLAALELLVAGVPLVATAVGSLPELVADGGGRVVPSGDANALAEALAAELADVGFRDRQLAAERARTRFGLERVALDVQRVYDEILAVTSNG